MENASSASTSPPVPESVANALMSIHPRYNSFHQHNAFPNADATGSLGTTYGQSADPGPGMAANHQNGLSTGNGGNGAVQPAATSVINLSNSSDVVIGPMTQYQGAVTIYQYMDATVEASRIATSRNNQNRGLPSSSAEPSTLRQERYFIYGALIFFAIVGFSTAIYFIVNQLHGPADIEREILFGDNYRRRTMPSLGNSHMIIDRRNWGSQTGVHASVPLDHPVHYVLVTHIGVRAKICAGMHDCSNRMRMLQDAAIAERYLPDIPSNFYTKQTTSPGDRLYDRIVRLPRWSPCGTPTYAHCGSELGFPAVWDEERDFNDRNGIKNTLLIHRANTEEE